MILEATAKRNEGLCAPCKRHLDCGRREIERDQYRKNPPKTREEIDRIVPDTIENLGLRIFLEGLLPRRLEPSNFTKKRFVQALKEIVVEHAPNKVEICTEFLGLFDSVNQSQSLIGALKRLPRPYREAMALFQLWGMLASDGISSYLENSDRRVDSEVNRGLSLFGRSDLLGAVDRARKAFDPLEGLPDVLEAEIEGNFFRYLGNFESELLGEFLIERLGNP